MYAARLTHGPVELAFTDRHGGVSAAPYDSLNLAWAGGDEPRAMEENHRLVMADFSPGAGLESLAQLSQVHGNDVAVVGADGPAHDVHGHLHAVGDGLVTTQPGVSLMVRAADCVPVLLADRDGTVVGAAHCGRDGLVAGLVAATVTQLERDGVEVVDLSTCTRESPDLFSYRRDGPRSGRQAGIIRIAS